MFCVLLESRCFPDDINQQVGPFFRQTEGVLWWGGGGTRKATESLVFRVQRTNTSFLYPSAPHAHTRVYTITFSMDVIMKCDDFVFSNRHHYQSGEVPHKGHVVEVAASAQPSAVQRGRSSLPPADSTEGCAAQGPNTSSRPNDANCEAQCRHDM